MMECAALSSYLSLRPILTATVIPTWSSATAVDWRLRAWSLEKETALLKRSKIMQVAESPSQIAVADLNGDNRPDIVISSGNASGMLVTLINEYGVVSDSDKP
jgi:FG-GAP repeat